MNNLSVVREVSTCVPLVAAGESALSKVSSDALARTVTWDLDRKRLFSVTKDGNVLVEEEAADGGWQVSRYHSLAESGHLPPPPSATVCSKWVHEKESLFLALSNGDLLLCSGEPRGGERGGPNFSSSDATGGVEVEEIGAINGGILAAAFSPDESWLAVVTGEGQLLLMMAEEWEVMGEVALEQAMGAEGSRNPADWLAPPTPYSASVEISWRGDSKFFATISTDRSGERSVRVWERETCALHSMARPDRPTKFGLPIAWRPNGSLIAAVGEKLPVDEGSPEVVGVEGQGGGETDSFAAEVVFFERNGLERSRCPVVARGLTSGQVAAVDWSCDSELLAVVVKGAEYEALQVYHRCNYVWYLKFERRLPPSSSADFLWHPERDLELLLWTKLGSLSSLHFAWGTAVAHRSVAAVINGPHLLVTPFNEGIVPPPMFALKVAFSAPILAVAGRRLEFGGGWGPEEGEWFWAALVTGGKGKEGGRRHEGEGQPVGDSWCCALSNGSLGIAFLRDEDEEDEQEGEDVIDGNDGERGEENGSRGTDGGEVEGGEGDKEDGEGFGDEDLAVVEVKEEDFEWEGCSGPRGLGSSLGRVRHVAWAGDRSMVALVSDDVDICAAESSGTGSRYDAPVGGDWLLGIRLELREVAKEEGGGSGRKFCSGKWKVKAVVHSATRVDQRVVRLMAVEAVAGSVGSESRGLEIWVYALQEDGTVLGMKEVEMGQQSWEAAWKFPLPCSSSMVFQLSQFTTAPDVSSDVSYEGQFGFYGRQFQGRKADRSGLGHREVFFGLTESGCLFCGDFTVSSECTSFTVHRQKQSYTRGDSKNDLLNPAGVHVGHQMDDAQSLTLVYTTRSDEMVAIGFEEVFAEAAAAAAAAASGPRGGTNAKVATSTTIASNGQTGALSERKAKVSQEESVETIPVWERGAKLFCSLENDAGVLLFVPRGNIEVVYHRALVLKAIGLALLACRFLEAFQLARRHRVDLNVLVDFGGWERFVANAALFVREVGRADLKFVAELLCRLSLKNSMEGAYGVVLGQLEKKILNSESGKDDVHAELRAAGKGGGVTAGQKEHSDAGNGQNKVSAVCGAIRAALEQDFEPSLARETCILTSLCCSEPPDLDGALRAVKKIRDEEVAGALRAERNTPGNETVVEGNEKGERHTSFVKEEAGEESMGDLGMVPSTSRPTGWGKTIDASGKEVRAAAGISAEAAIKHLLWLTNSDRLFDKALGTYDLELAAIVGIHSQKDPKEFVPLLEELEALPEPIRRFQVDMRLGRLESALRHLSQAGSSKFQECLDLVRRHPKRLFPLASKIFCESGSRSLANSQTLKESVSEVLDKETPSRQKAEVLCAWGDFLLREERYEDAAVAFASGRDFDRALAAYRAGGLHRGVFIMAGKLGFGKEGIVQLAGEVREELVAMGKREEAGRVAVEYQGDVEGGVKLFTECGRWQEAVRMAFAHWRGDLVDGFVAAAAVDAAENQMAEFDETAGKIASYLSRFKTVHHRRQALNQRLQEAELEGEGMGDGAGWDDGRSVDGRSEVSSSNLSALSAYGDGLTSSHSRAMSSAQSSTNSVTTAGGRRSARRASKMAKQSGKNAGRIRAGSPGEELALVEHLRGLTPPQRQREEIGELLEVLVTLGRDDLAKRLQSKTEMVIKAHKAASVEVDDLLRLEEEKKLMNAGSVSHGAKKLDGLNGEERAKAWKYITLENHSELQ